MQYRECTIYSGAENDPLLLSVNLTEVREQHLFMLTGQEIMWYESHCGSQIYIYICMNKF